MQDECDYMSDDFLAKCTENDVRPGLLRNRALQRNHDIHKSKIASDEKNKKLFRPLKEIEQERRNEGLEKAIGETNKGFAMLQKMGYKSGEGIGKTGEGCKAPISISLKTNRMGLGRESALKEIAERKAMIKAERMEKLKVEVNPENFRLRITQKAQERQDEADFKKSQRVCQDLDLKKTISQPAEVWFWPIVETEQNEDESDTDEEEQIENEYTVSEKLEMLTMYLRRTHDYCIWCGTQFDDERDMKENCPGATREEH